MILFSPLTNNLSGDLWLIFRIIIHHIGKAVDADDCNKHAQPSHSPSYNVEKKNDVRVCECRGTRMCVVIVLLLSCPQVVGEYGMAHFSDKGKSNGKDYCIFFNSQWARLPQDLNKAVSCG